ncbi:PAS domain S-box protein [Neorhizobium lilium]|uniref:PAS domain S-box protein n=1 Tax=Neorhizobium lilium TaxID=2503024 RepID=UPI0013E3F0BB|nr:PAS domain S-box protein [Neorhizobium lilium]
MPRGTGGRFDRLIDKYADVTWEADTLGNVVDDSESWRAFTGQTLEEMLGYGWLDAVHPDDRAYTEHQWREAIHTGRYVDTEFRVLHVTNGWRWTNSVATPLLDEDGTVRKWIGMNVDIHDRKQADDIRNRHMAELERQVEKRTAELRASRDFLRGVIDSSPDMIQVFDAVRNDRREIIDFVWTLNNQTSEDRYGAAWGESLLQRNPGVVEADIFDAFKRVVETGVPEQAEHHYVHEQFDGWFLQSVVKLGDGVATTTRDITADKVAQAELLRLRGEVAEAALRESEDRYHVLFDSIDEGFCTIEVIFDERGQAADYRFLEINPAFARQTGLIDSVGKSARSLIPKHEQFWFDTYGNIAKTGQPKRFEHRAAALGRWYDVYAFRIGGAENCRVAVLFHDIKPRKLAEEALRKSEEQIRALVEASSDVVYSLNPDWQEMRHLFGRGFLVDGERPSARWMDDYIFPEDHASIRAVIDKAIADRGPFELEHRVRRTDGSEGWTFSRAIPVFGDDGDIVEWFGMAADVTERIMAQKAAHHANAALQRSEERHRLIVESALDYAIFTTDEEGKVEDWPPGAQSVFGWTPEEIVGKDLAITYTPEDRAAGVPETELRKALQDGFAENVRWHMRKDGSRVFIEGFARPLPSGDTGTAGVVKIGQNVTARKRWEETQNALVAELQHRTRNLIAVVRSIAEQTMRETGPTPDFMDRFADRMSALSRVQGLLSRSEMEPITIGTLAEMELSALGSVAHRVSVDGPEVLLKNSTVQTFALAIHELATNARKYGALSTDDGNLKISWAPYETLDGEKRLLVDWLEEVSGPRLTETVQKTGYGRELIEKALPYTLGAKTTYEMTDTHLHCTIDLPIKRRKTGRQA